MDGSSFRVNQLYDFTTIDSPTGTEIQMTLTNHASDWLSTAEGDTWQLEFPQAPFSGTGYANMTEPFPFEAAIELRDATGSGVILLQSADFNPLRVSLSISGELWADLAGGDFVEIGTARMDAHFTFTPVMVDWMWPLSAGDSWTYEMGATAFGSLTVNMFGVVITYPIDGTTVMLMLATVAPDLHVDVVQLNGPTTMRHTYNHECQWYGYKEMRDIGNAGITVNQLLWEITDCEFTPCPTATPTPTPTMATSTPAPPTETPPPPTATPQPPTATPVPPTATPGTVTPEPTADIRCDLILNQTLFRPNDTFLLECRNVNTGPSMTVEQYILLDIFGEYWFWPGWTQAVDFRQADLPARSDSSSEILRFVWPDTAGAMSGIRFWAAFLAPASATVIGEYDMVEWGFTE